MPCCKQYGAAWPRPGACRWWPPPPDRSLDPFTLDLPCCALTFAGQRRHCHCHCRSAAISVALSVLGVLPVSAADRQNNTGCNRGAFPVVRHLHIILIRCCNCCCCCCCAHFSPHPLHTTSYHNHFIVFILYRQ